MLTNPNTVLPLFIAFVLGITIHEFAHAFVAYRLGDMTPMNQGRVTLNPRAHMTFWGTILIFLIGFGWGKPVMHRIWDPRQRLWVSIAGPVSNLILAFLFGLLFRFGLAQQLNIGPQWLNLYEVLSKIVEINVLLAVFNMIPLSPLDGSSVFAGILPEPYSSRLANYNAQYPQALIVFLLGDMLLSSILGQSLLWTILGPPINFFVSLFAG
ncbi:MAG: site-2 protease family protein [Ardenticatenaceae bacterium]